MNHLTLHPISYFILVFCLIAYKDCEDLEFNFHLHQTEFCLIQMNLSESVVKRIVVYYNQYRPLVKTYILKF